ncbi:MAG: type III-B CRISPR module RAMP protein Cmr6 [Methylobacter sp.]|nr:MAG: type III-B CRISPR module RAMP protein Cmr6 [Methylobacter sp.]PPD18697.1 MAG: type III-B CRISPR module RAMP protein Cmr6 [Methylobacter sp.]PPD32297.1 MAG: type III-B CRISPR module RAMP protein Cmr6 [Methylomonas sp.]
MTELQMRRDAYQVAYETCQHAGLLLERGFKTWHSENTKHADAKNKFYAQLTRQQPGNAYPLAFERWLAILQDAGETSKTWVGDIDGRLYLGLGEANPLESAVTLHHTYGVPFIPGSAVKGVLRQAYLADYADVNEKTGNSSMATDARETFHILFGREADTDKRGDSGDAGYLVYNDAWWIPQGKKPLVEEVVTVHHAEYYVSQGQIAATDFDSPNPNPQIAIQGSFLFSLEGAEDWADFAIGLLAQTLANRGLGAKTASGYGFFRPSKSLIQETLEWPAAIIGSYTRAGLGRVIEAVCQGKRATCKYEELNSFIASLSKADKKRLQSNTLKKTVKVKANGNRYQLIQIVP